MTDDVAKGFIEVLLLLPEDTTIIQPFPFRPELTRVLILSAITEEGVPNEKEQLIILAPLLFAKLKADKIHESSVCK
ncbi:MAG: hypothetical protein KH181_09515 [Subdoligranulum variabile]|nr:hypothetical protein [Subdoligranulum variabile]